MLRRARLASAVLLGAAASLSAAPGASEGPIHGVRGQPVARVVLRWSDMDRQGAGAPLARLAKNADETEMISQDLPVPPGALIRMETRAAAPVLPAGMPPSPPPAASFEAVSSREFHPPDTHGAVGPNHLMVTLNSQVRIQDRSGNALSTVPLWSFWERLSAGGPGEVFDPRVVYDPYADRWITTAVGSHPRGLLVGVSQTADPTESWYLYRIDPAPLNVDFPSLGFNKDWIVVMGSHAGDTRVGTKIWVFGKANLYAGGNGSFTSFSAEPRAMAAIPAVTLDPDISALYLVSNWSGNAEGNGVLRLYKITGPIGAELLTAVAFVATPNPWANLSDGIGGQFCPQRGDPRGILCFGAPEVFFRNGTIWMAHAILLPADAPTRIAVQWWQLAPDGGVLQRGRLEDALGARFYAFPSIAVNGNGDMLLGFASFSAEQFASGSYAYRAAGDPPGTLRAERVLKAGEDIYVEDQEGFGTIRWGDYSGTSVDPVNDSDFWTIQEYAATRDVNGNSRWGTWWGRVVPEAVERTPPRIPERSRTPRALPPRGP